MPDAGPRLDRDVRPHRALVGIDQPQRLLDGIDHLDRADDDAAKRVAALGPQPSVGRGLACERRQQAGAERVAGERSGEVAAASQPSVQRRRMRDLPLDDMLGNSDGASRPAVVRRRSPRSMA